MSTDSTRDFGRAISHLLAGEDFGRAEMRALFERVLSNAETEMHQGAFLAALSAKGETADEIAAAWEAIYELDTVKVTPDVDGELMENSGTGMDPVKTFNISTAASIAAASAGVLVARHGARAITSSCGTVDAVEALGVDVEVAPEVTRRSIETCGIGLFNGMSPQVHPFALGRILSQISFGTILNTAASLANPAKPTLGVRGVYDPAMVEPVARIMAEVGYRRALVVHGLNADGAAAIDEAGTLGETVYAELKPDHSIEVGRFAPEDVGLRRAQIADIAASGDTNTEARRLVAMFAGRRDGADTDIVCLNTGCLLYVAGRASSLANGVSQARDLFADGRPLDLLRRWVSVQASDPNAGERRLEELARAAA